MNNLWEITLGKTENTHLSNNTRFNIDETDYTLYNVFKISSLSSIIQYLHEVCFYLVKSTWLAAIKRGNLQHGLSRLKTQSKNNLTRHQ